MGGGSQVLFQTRMMNTSMCIDCVDLYAYLLDLDVWHCVRGISQVRKCVQMQTHTCTCVHMLRVYVYLDTCICVLDLDTRIIYMNVYS